MPGKFHHETLYRGPELLAKLSKLRLVICGVGAIGSNLADNLVRQGAGCVRAVDHDKVEEHNISTQLYGESDVGVWKVEALRTRLFRATGVEIEPTRKELTGQNAHRLLKDADLIVDCFDNALARQLVQEAARSTGMACLHVGLYEEPGSSRPGWAAVTDSFEVRTIMAATSPRTIAATSADRRLPCCGRSAARR